ncbi:hypothetical protein FRC03_003617 [Tulasnella sp. 419]|nr:hypothetical protein FRC03_003617 [Tulasnella sp. 419]
MTDMAITTIIMHKYRLNSKTTMEAVSSIKITTTIIRKDQLLRTLPTSYDLECHHPQIKPLERGGKMLSFVLISMICWAFLLLIFSSSVILTGM